jgi:D-arabinose 1-dehydrogenase-like Zn-dependent alcohol dehydrogenase
MKMSNKAAWINSKGEAIKVCDAEMPTPGPGQLVIKVYYSHVFVCLETTNHAAV